jgi:hypothetical protein
MMPLHHQATLVTHAYLTTYSNAAKLLAETVAR